MVSGRSDGPPASRRLTLPQSTSYDKSRKPHVLRAGVDTKSVHFEWISKELECGICEKTIQNTMVVRNCMHRFCADCILQRIHTGARKCPSCHKVLPKKTPLKSDANFDAIINKAVHFKLLSLQFTLSVERRCVKRPITESSNLCFTKKRVFDKKSSSKRLANLDSIAPSLSGRISPKNVKTSMKYDSLTDSTANTPLEIKPPLLPSMHSDASDPPLTIDEGSSDVTVRFAADAYPNLQQPTTSSYAKSEDRSNFNDADEKRNKPSRLVSNRCELTPVVVLQKSSSHERLNGMAAKNAHVNGKSERSTKCITVYPSLGPSTHTVSNQTDSNVNVNFRVKRAMNPKMGDGLLLPPSLSAEDVVLVSPRSSEYLLMSGKQRLSSGIDSELVLNPDASVVNDDSLPIAAKHLRYIVTCPTTTVGHLCEYILQRIRVESRTERDKKCAEKCLLKRVLLCPVKSDLALDDVLVVNETGEGQFTTINVGERNSDPKSASVFTINSPFAGFMPHTRKTWLFFQALDESITIEQLKAEYWANRKRPLKLIFKFIGKS
uniref:RING-type E3 ubiquitin transferase n=1 Tax=Setaria digitata TaxID=48799 RepID=A0A915PXL4_9BILA